MRGPEMSKHQAQAESVNPLATPSARAEPETTVSEPVEDSRDTAAARADVAAGAPGDGRVGSATKCAAGDAPAIGGIASPVLGHVDSKKRNPRHKVSGDSVLAFANTSATHPGASAFASADDRRWQPEVYFATAALAAGILRVGPSGNVRP